MVMTAPDTEAAAQQAGRAWLGILLVVAGCLGVVEIVLRVRGLPRPATALAQVKPAWQSRADVVSDSATFWRLAPTNAAMPGNSRGLRGRDPDPALGDRHFRIAVVGGSVACGVGLELSDSVAQRLERAAQQEAPGACVETVMLGLPDGSSWQDAELWRQHGAELAPHLVVLYGNFAQDITAAHARADAEVARDLAHPSPWHLWRFVQGWSAAPRKTGPRVALPDFEHNVNALVAGARAAGAALCVVLPALGADFTAAHPEVTQYRQALRQIAPAAAARVVDADALISAYATSLPEPPCAELGASHGLRDGVNLSSPGSALLSEALLAVVRTHPRFHTLSQHARDAAIAVSNVQPPSVAALARATVTVHGQGFAQARYPRLRIGTELVTNLQVVDDNRLNAVVPFGVPVGRHPLQLVSATGLAAIPDDVMLEVTPLQLDASLRRADGKLEFDLRGQAAAGCAVQVWVSPAGRATPIDTPAGPFWLQYGEIGAKKSRAPFCFSALPLHSFRIEPGADGAWQSTVRWNTAGQLDGAQAILQGVAWLPHGTGRAVTTDVIVRVVPR
jgi:lysophospholipase L1-like esterase